MSDDVKQMMLDDSTDLLDNVEVTTIADQCHKLKALQDDIDRAEEHVSNLKKMADDISSRVIPELLAEQGLSSLKLADGSSVTVKREYRCTLPKEDERRQSAYNWLRENGLGDIIKNNVSVTFGRGEDDKAQQLLDLAASKGFNPHQKSDVAWNLDLPYFFLPIEAAIALAESSDLPWVNQLSKSAPNTIILTAIVDALFFYGTAYLEVTEVYLRYGNCYDWFCFNVA